MGHVASVIAWFYLGLVIIGLVISVALWRSTRARRKQVDQHKLERRERGWLVVVVVLLVAMLFGTIFFTPYDYDAKGSNKQVVTVQAQQFGFVMSPTTIKAGVPTEFVLTSTDVNHGFGVYDPDEEFVTQVQIVPGDTQKLTHTFEKLGRYKVLCFEFCGVGHHVMQASFEVTE